jgi:DNA invertase Pin-like site-specific DNA recombinase
MRDITATTTESGLAVGYLRTASAGQRDGRLSLRRQRLACEEHARQLGLRLGATYADVGVSGLSESRPALDQLLRDLSRGHIRVVVVTDPARLARNRKLEDQLQDRIRRQGAAVACPGDCPTITNRGRGNHCQ